MPTVLSIILFKGSPTLSLQSYQTVDRNQLAKDINEIHQQSLANTGIDDFKHLEKMERWGKLCTIVGYATAWLMPNPISAIPLGAPTQYPGQPVTHGAAAGPGAGPEALILPNPVQAQYENASQMFNAMAASPDASPALKYLAMRIGQGF